MDMDKNSVVNVTDIHRQYDDKTSMRKAIEEVPGEKFEEPHKRYAAILQKYYTYNGTIFEGLDLTGITLKDITKNTPKFEKRRELHFAEIYAEANHESKKLEGVREKRKSYIPKHVVKIASTNVRKEKRREVKLEEEIQVKKDEEDIKKESGNM